MTCDDAFERISSPADAARNSPELHAHLAGCGRCRQMQEALSPLVSGFAWSKPAETQQLAPWFQPNAGVSAPSVSVAERSAATLSRRARLALWTARANCAGRYATATLVGMAGGLLMCFPAIPSRDAAPSSTCTRAALKSTEANDATFKSLLSQTCVVCHREPQKKAEDLRSFIDWTRRHADMHPEWLLEGDVSRCVVLKRESLLGWIG